MMEEGVLARKCSPVRLRNLAKIQERLGDGAIKQLLLDYYVMGESVGTMLGSKMLR
jgi:hypothetical protein